MRSETPPGAPPLLRIEVLGRFRVTTGPTEVAPSAWRRRRPATVVKLLALADDHRLPVDQVTAALWPRLDAAAARQNLHNALYHARRALQPGLSRGDALQWLLHEDGELRLGAPVAVDLEEFEQATARALGTPSEARHLAAIAMWQPGGLLPQDRYEEWAAPRADAGQQLHLRLQRGLAELRTARGDHQGAIEALSDAVAADPFHEQAQAQLIRAFTASGQRHLALRQHQRYSALLARDFDGVPGPAAQQAHREARAGSSTAARAPQPEAGNLPVPISRFVGRADDVAAIRRLLAQERMVTLSGPGGVGKTRLAIKAAAAQEPDFADGVWLADFSELTDAALVTQVVARALRVAEVPGHDLRASLAASLRERQLLLVLDTCEHVCVAAAELLTELLTQCPSLSVLCTSRQTLQVAGESVYWVPAMRLPDAGGAADRDPGSMGEAVELFCERARAVRPSFAVTAENAEVIHEIALRLEGIPLAIELAAARLKVLSLNDLASALDDRLPLLTTQSPTTVPRHQTLRQTIQWSCDLLSPGAAGLLQRLAVCPGSWSLDYARALAASTGVEEPVLDLTTELVDKSMITAREVGDSLRYWMLDTVREYVYETLCAQESSDRVHRAHGAAMVELVEQVPSRTLPFQAMAHGWFDRLEAEQPNLRGALDHALHQTRDKETALRLCAGLRWFWVERGHFEEGTRALVGALALGPDAADGPLASGIANGRLTLALLCWRGGDYPRALASASEARDRFARLEDPWGTALALCVLGMIGQLQGDPEAAAQNEASLVIYRALDDDYGVTWQLLLLAQQGLRTDQLHRAQELTEEGLRVARAAVNPFGEGWALAHLSMIAEARGELALAEQHLEQAFGALESEDRWASELVRVALVRTCALRDDLPAARRHAVECLRGFTSMPSSVEFGVALHAVGLIAHRGGDSALGARLTGAGEQLCPLDHLAPLLVGRDALRRDREQIERALGREAFAAEMDAGLRLRLADAVALAVSVAHGHR